MFSDRLVRTFVKFRVCQLYKDGRITDDRFIEGRLDAGRIISVMCQNFAEFIPYQ